MPSNTELAAKLAALSEKATAGPWRDFEEDVDVRTGEYSEPFVCAEPTADGLQRTIAVMRVGLKERAIDNADLIVTTRNALPAIIAALKDHERLEYERTFESQFADKLKEFGTIDRLIEGYSAYKIRCRDLEADHGRLVEALREMVNSFTDGFELDVAMATEKADKLLAEIDGRAV